MTTSKEEVNEGPVHALARSAWQSILVTGILSVVLGILILAWPGKTLLVAGVLFGVYLIVSGFFQLIAAFGTHLSAGMRILAFISAILTLILGFLCFHDWRDKGEATAVLLLAIWIGISWIFRGVSSLIVGISGDGMPGRGWAIFFGIMLVIGGGWLIAAPFTSLLTLTLVVGWWLIFIGIMEIFSAFQVRRGAKNVPAGL
ncbi:HdeD family acid-resistance protein [Nocardia sp. SYP-A9097]|uniref:HdeD family acid-resistance protein n=1 Tax=Nocardia sp. SYP-A9097 TaxID=2663237 RepID=UPI00129B592C|nr:HdeD family acid-resistance protein [Nocardia sp. SYP-A9097]MRH90618.1 HdeD family acid-resistance protein [Nocardia sp. SYP-A9097]